MLQGTYVVGGIDEIIAMLDDHIVKVTPFSFVHRIFPRYPLYLLTHHLTSR